MSRMAVALSRTTDESDLIHPKPVRHIAVWGALRFYGLGFEVIAFALLMAYFKRERWF